MRVMYLAGPLDGCTYEESIAWRDDVISALENIVECLSPLRGKDELAGTTLGGAGNSHLTSQRGIFRRDLDDVKRSDIILVNLLGAKKASIGTTSEIAWAYLLGKIVVIVMEEKGNIHDHLFIREELAYRVTSVSEAISLVKRLI